MLYLLLTFALLIPTFAGVGRIFSDWIRLWKGISADLICGIVVISITWTLLSFFIPLSIEVEIITILLGVLSFIYHKQYQEFGYFLRENKKVFGIVFLFILFFGAFAPFILDHFGYYVPSILWLREVGLVKGIANLDLLLGQMSIWHILQAGFSHFSDVYLRINAVLLGIYLFYLLEKKNYLHLAFFPILFLFVQSPSPDLPVIILSLILLNETLNINRNIGSLFLLSVFIFIIKPTAIWTIILTSLYGLFFLKNYSFRWFIMGGFVLALFFFKNIWLFGYPIFPVAVIDLNVDWKPHPMLLQDSAKIAIQKTYDMQYSYEEIQQFTKWDYIKNWLFLNGIKSKIHITFLISLVIFGVFSIRSKQKIILFIYFSILVKSIAVLLFSAQYRFFLEVFFVIIFIMGYYNISRKWVFFSFFTMSICIGIVLSTPKILQTHIPSFYVGNFMREIRKDHWKKPSTYSLKKYTTHRLGNLTFNLSEKYPFMFDTPPSTISLSFVKDYIQFGIFPQQYTHNIKNGFYWRPLTDAEKAEAKAILEAHTQEKNQKK